MWRFSLNLRGSDDNHPFHGRTIFKGDQVMIIYRHKRLHATFRGLLIALAVAAGQSLYGQNGAEAPYPEPDNRYKTDLLLIVPHPDDETAVGAYLAKAIFDEGKVVSIIYCNRGDGGGNTVGVEQSLSLGAVREIEARKAVAEFGITKVWFLDGRDTPGQDVFRSLQNLKHGASLEQIVRLIRLTRPEVILTWLPHFVSGENHGDHQAVGVMTTEAFDMAGDPTAFPTQVAPPREPMDIGNANEGLWPWQPKKIYYFSDAEEPLEADGPAFDITAVSPSRGVPYYELAANLHKHHLAQGEVAQVALDAIASGDWEEFIDWMDNYSLIFGKAVVACRPEGGVFEGIQPGAHPYVPAQGYRPAEREGVTLELGGAFAFYKEFWQAHGLDHLAALRSSEIMVAAGSYMHIPLLLHNETKQTVEVVLASRIPAGWQELMGAGMYRLAPNETRPVQTFFFAAAEIPDEVQVLIWEGKIGRRSIGSVRLNVNLREWTLPQ